MIATGPIKGISTTTSKVRVRIKIPRIMPISHNTPLFLSKFVLSIFLKKRPGTPHARHPSYFDEPRHHLEKSRLLRNDRAHGRG